jgi:hypothetical protein
MQLTLAALKFFQQVPNREERENEMKVLLLAFILAIAGCASGSDPKPTPTGSPGGAYEYHPGPYCTPEGAAELRSALPFNTTEVGAKQFESTQILRSGGERKCCNPPGGYCKTAIYNGCSASETKCKSHAD